MIMGGSKKSGRVDVSHILRRTRGVVTARKEEKCQVRPVGKSINQSSDMVSGVLGPLGDSPSSLCFLCPYPIKLITLWKWDGTRLAKAPPIK